MSYVFQPNHLTYLSERTSLFLAPEGKFYLNFAFQR